MTYLNGPAMPVLYVVPFCLATTRYFLTRRSILHHQLEQLGIAYVDVNLSPIQCMTPTLSDTLFTIMNEYGIKPNQINLEITETAKSDNNTANYLLQYPFSVVKIDKQILWQAMTDETAMIVFRNMVALIKKLDKKIVVEGGETQEMIDLLIQENCDYCQGYFFSKPLKEEAFIDFLQSNH